MARLVYCDDPSTRTISWGPHTYTYELLALIFGLDPAQLQPMESPQAGVPMGPRDSYGSHLPWGPPGVK